MPCDRDRRSTGKKAARRSAGFTLIEVMVVLVIVALVGTGLSVGLGVVQGRETEREVERLRLVLEATAERALVRGQAITLEFLADGYRFSAFETDGTWRPLKDAPVFVERVWPEGVRVHGLRVEGEDRSALPRIVFGTATPEFELRLSTPSGEVILDGRMNGAVTRRSAGEVLR